MIRQYYDIKDPVTKEPVSAFIDAVKNADGKAELMTPDSWGVIYDQQPKSIGNDSFMSGGRLTQPSWFYDQLEERLTKIRFGK